MWDRQKMCLAAIVFGVLYCCVAAEQAKLLGMAPDAIDHLYNECHKEAMEKIINSGLLRQELNHSKEFQKAWNRSTQCQRLIPGGIKEHTAALLSYVNGDTTFIETFNDEVETLGINASIYENDFHFKSLHFLLMDYMRLQKPKNCKNVYCYPERLYTAQNGTKVRLGHFFTADTDFKSLMQFSDIEGGVLLNITSCFFAELRDNICKTDETNVLLSPAEVFTVESINKRKLEDIVYMEIVLKHLELRSFRGCPIFSRCPAAVSAEWLGLALVALSSSFFI